MAKSKGKKIMKVVTMSVLSFGLLGVSLYGITTAFASAAPESTPTTVAYALAANESIQSLSATSEEFVAQDLRVYDKTEAGTVVSTNAISLDEAAQIGAEYIWEMFGESIDGMAVEMQYNNLMQHGGSTNALFGTVSNGSEIVFNFMVDAFTGERMMVSRPASNATDTDVSEAWAMMQRAAGSGQCAFPVELSQSELDSYLDVARGFAEKHFNNSNVADVSFTVALASSFDRDANGNIIVTSRRLHFDATDDAGRTVMVSIYQDSQELSVISTPIEFGSDYVLVAG